MIRHGSGKERGPLAQPPSPTLAAKVSDAAFIGLAIGLARPPTSLEIARPPTLRPAVAVSSKAATVDAELAAANDAGNDQKLQAASARQETGPPPAGQAS